MTDNILLVIAQKNFNDIEYSVSKSILEKKKYNISAASLKKEPAYGLSLKVEPDLTVEESVYKVNDYDAVLIIGGIGCPTLYKKETIQLLNDANKLERIIGGICLGPTILAKAGILDGKMATVWKTDEHPDGPKILKEHGAIYSEDPVVIDGNIVTAQGPEYAASFAYLIDLKLSERKKNKLKERQTIRF